MRRQLSPTRTPMHKKFTRELIALGLPKGPDREPDVVTEADLANLPAVVQRYFRHMRVLGRPRDWSFRIAFTGRFRRSPEAAWMKCETLQYNTRLSLARIFYIVIRFGGLVPVLARDTYVNGRGRMLIRLMDRFTVGDGTGEEYDIGELVTYLNDAIFIAPGMLLAPEIDWTPLDESSFEVILTDAGRRVKAKVFLDERGAPVNFETTDRFYADPADPSKTTRLRWTTPIQGSQLVLERPLWTTAQAIWHFPDGTQLPYADFEPIADSLAFNVAPGD